MYLSLVAIYLDLKVDVLGVLIVTHVVKGQEGARLPLCEISDMIIVCAAYFLDVGVLSLQRLNLLC